MARKASSSTAPGRTRCAVSAVSVVDVQIVHRRDARQASEARLNRRRIEAARHGVHGQIEGFPQQTPGADEDHRPDRQAERGVNPAPAGPADQYRPSDDARRDAGIGGEMQESGAPVHVATAHEKQRGPGIHPDPEERHPEHQAGGHGMRRAEALQAFQRDPAGHQQQQHGIAEGSKDARAVKAVSAPTRGRPPGEAHRTPGDEQPEHIREIMSGIGNEGERAAKQAGHPLGQREAQVQQRGGEEALLGGGRAMAVTARAMRVAVFVGRFGSVVPMRAWHAWTVPFWTVP